MAIRKQTEGSCFSFQGFSAACLKIIFPIWKQLCSVLSKSLRRRKQLNVLAVYVGVCALL